MRRAPGLALAAMVAIAGCGGDDGGSETVELDMDARVADGTISVDGTTDLPDGALIAYEVTLDNSAEDAEILDLFDTGTASVSDGTFLFDVPIDSWPAGDVTIWVTFQTVVAGDSQPASVLEKYGDSGERMGGPNVTGAGDLKRVELEQTIAIP